MYVCVVKSLAFILAVSFFEIGHSFPAAHVDVFKCPTRNGHFEKPGSCSSFYKCTSWRPEVIECTGEKNFFPARGYCVDPELYPCLDKPKNKECPQPKGKFLKQGTGCRMYYDCCNGEPTEKKCPEDQLFDPRKQKCEWPELSSCPEGISVTDSISTDPNFITSSIASSTITTLMSQSDSSEETERVSTGIMQSTTNSYKTSFITSIATYSDSNTSDNKFTASRQPTTSSSAQTIQTDKDDSDSSEEDDNKFTESRKPTSSPTTQSIQTDDSDESDSNSSEEDGDKFTGSRQPTTSPTTQSIQTDDSDSSEEGGSNSSEEDDNKFTGSRQPTTGPTTQSIQTDYSVSSKEDDNTSSDNGTDNLIIDLTTSSLSLPPTSERTVDSTVSKDSTDKSTDSSGTTKRDGKIDEDSESTAITWDKTDSVTLNIFCPEPSGYFPHPNDKHKFIGCVGGDPRIIECPSNLVYVHEIRACDYE